MTGDRKVVATWGLVGVIPVRWTGPSLNLDTPKVATETLEIAHHGFLPRSRSDTHAPEHDRLDRAASPAASAKSAAPAPLKGDQGARADGEGAS